MLRVVALNYAIKLAENAFEDIMILRGYYWHAGRYCWRRRGVITMQRFKDKSKPVLQQIAEAKARDDAYHRRDTVAFPDQEAERLGVDLEWRCLNAIVERVTRDPHEAQGTRIDILELANRFIARIMPPGSKPDPEVKSAAIMAAIYRYNEQLILGDWLEGQKTYLLDRVLKAQKIYVGSLVTLATVSRCKWEILEKVGEQFQFGKTG